MREAYGISSKRRRRSTLPCARASLRPLSFRRRRRQKRSRRRQAKSVEKEARGERHASDGGGLSARGPSPLLRRRIRRLRRRPAACGAGRRRVLASLTSSSWSSCPRPSSRTLPRRRLSAARSSCCFRPPRCPRSRRPRRPRCCCCRSPQRCPEVITIKNVYVLK